MAGKVRLFVRICERVGFEQSGWKHKSVIVESGELAALLVREWEVVGAERIPPEHKEPRDE